MTSVVTGASGHVGGNLVRALLAEGRQIRVVHREDTRAFDGLDVERCKADLFDPESLARAFKGADTVFHLAAKISIVPGQWDLIHRTNVEGVRNVVDACLKNNVRRLVHVSSIHAFRADPVDQTLDEERVASDTKRKCHDYDRSKAMGQRVVLEAVAAKGLDAVIVNPTAIIGPNDFKFSRMGRTLHAFFSASMPFTVKGGYDWVDVRDIAAGIMAAEKQGRAGEKYLLSGTYLTVQELGVRRPIAPMPIWVARMAVPFATLWYKLTGAERLLTHEALTTLCGNRCISHEKATRELDYHPRPLETTLTDACQWFRDQNML